MTDFKNADEGTLWVFNKQTALKHCLESYDSDSPEYEQIMEKCPIAIKEEGVSFFTSVDFGDIDTKEEALKWASSQTLSPYGTLIIKLNGSEKHGEVVYHKVIAYTAESEGRIGWFDSLAVDLLEQCNTTK